MTAARPAARMAMLIALAGAATPALAAGGGVSISVSRIIAAFLLCCMVALAVALLLRRRHSAAPLSFRALLTGAQAGTGHAVEVVETRRMSLHGDICVVRWRDAEYLVACGPGGMLLLGEATISRLGQAPSGEPGSD